MKLSLDPSRIPALLAVVGVVLLSAAFFELARRVMILQELRNRETTRDLVQADFNNLVSSLQVMLEQSWREKEGAQEGLVERRFRLDRNGSFIAPHLPDYQLLPPVPRTRREWLEGQLRQAAEFRLQQRLNQSYILLGEALSRAQDPTSLAILNFEAAKVAEELFGLEVARTHLEEILQEYRGALDLKGDPLAPLASRRLAALYFRGDPDLWPRGREILQELLELLAAGAWRVDPFVQGYLFRSTAEVLGEPLPERVLELRKLTVIGNLVARRAALDGWGGANPRWVTLYAHDRPALGGYKVVRRGDDLGLEGVVLRLDRLRAGLRRTGGAAALLAAGGGYLVEGAPLAVPLAQAGEPTGRVEMADRLVTRSGLNFRLQAFRPLPIRAWSERWLPWAGLLLILVALGGGTLLAIRSLHHEVVLARMRREFVDTVSHELRTPLTSIRLNADLLTRARLPEKGRTKALVSIQDEAMRLERMVSDILDLARMRRAGSEWLRPEPIGPRRLVEGVLQAYLPALEARGFEVQVETAPDLPRVMADPEATTRALGNLVGNAGKYSGDSRKIEIQLKPAGDRVAIAVVDHGDGVPRAERERIFRRFYRAPGTQASGVGLGLAVAREIVRGMGGDIKVRETPGGGTTFVVYLRCA